MKATIEVKDRVERDAIRAGLDDPLTRALVVTMGVLATLPSQAARQRVLNYVYDRLHENDQQATGVEP